MSGEKDRPRIELFWQLGLCRLALDIVESHSGVRGRMCDI